MFRSQTAVAVQEASQVGEARRAAALLAERAGLGDTDCGKVAIVVTELAKNLVRHTSGGGELLLRAWQPPGTGGEACGGVEILSVDRGPGMADVTRCLRDGFSTGGTSGTGLGAVKRLSAEFDIYSSEPAGTIVLSRVIATPPVIAARPPEPEFWWGVVNLPMRGESVCGDSWRLATAPGRLALIIADGLGHGLLAAEAAEAACAAFDADPFAGPRQSIEAAHERMRGSRGGAVAAFFVDATARVASFAGVGNIAGSIVSAADSRGLLSHNGTAGVQVRKVQEFDYPWPDGGMLIMHSDGLQTRWSLDGCPGYAVRHPALIAAVLYRDFGRGRDDLTVAVVRLKRNA